jgi:hypothetical protein
MWKLRYLSFKHNPENWQLKYFHFKHDPEIGNLKYLHFEHNLRTEIWSGTK